MAPDNVSHRSVSDTVLLNTVLLMLAALAVWMLPACVAAKRQPKALEPEAQSAPVDGFTPFTGAWSVRRCEDGAPPSATCGGFDAYLSQTGSRICGTHFGADERQNRMDEGEARSIIGTMVGSTAVLAITSSRSHAIYLVEAKRTANELSWRIIGTVKESDNGEPDFVANNEQLEGSQDKDQLKILEKAKADCAASRGTVGTVVGQAAMNSHRPEYPEPIRGMWMLGPEPCHLPINPDADGKLDLISTVFQPRRPARLGVFLPAKA